MIQSIHRFLFLLLASSFILFSSCSKEKELDFIMTDCNEVAKAFQYFETLSNDRNYVSRYEIQDDCFVFYLNTNEIVALPDKCIDDYSENPATSQLTITFNEGSVLTLTYGSLLELDFTYNPYKHTPLSGLIELQTDKAGLLKIIIEHKDPEKGEFIKTFSHPGGFREYPVLGLFFSHMNTLTFQYVIDGTIVYSDIYEVPVGDPPDYLPEIIIDVVKEDKMTLGMHLVSYRSKGNPTVAFMFDNDGEVRWLLDYTNHPDLSWLNFDVGMERLRNGNWYFGNWPSQNLYEADMTGQIINQWDIPGYEFHHNIQEKENGDFLVTATKWGSKHENDLWAIEDHILELDRLSGNIKTVWDLKESLDESRRSLGTDEFQGVIDWIHVNAVQEDPRDNTIIVSSRFQGIFKLDYNNNVKWILSPPRGWETNGRGEDLNPYLLTPVDASGQLIADAKIIEGVENHGDFEYPWMQHAHFIHPNGNLFMFDNGDRRNYDFREIYSRAVEYEIDEVNMTARQIWQYGKERGTNTFSRIVSDVDHHPDKNNILFSPGAWVDNGNGTLGGKIIELNYDTKEVVFEARLNAPGIVFHRVERLSLYPE
ncbi:MAG: hypothetical protein HKO89_02605 [Saprospiraceae bacterium]|nr:hypothetical protein [Saprospiraceae bacterium]